mgnify:CR=1 FL=1
MSKSLPAALFALTLSLAAPAALAGVLVTQQWIMPTAPITPKGGLQIAISGAASTTVMSANFHASRNRRRTAPGGATTMPRIDDAMTTPNRTRPRPDSTERESQVAPYVKQLTPVRRRRSAA